MKFHMQTMKLQYMHAVVAMRLQCKHGVVTMQRNERNYNESSTYSLTYFLPIIYSVKLSAYYDNFLLPPAKPTFTLSVPISKDKNTNTCLRRTAQK